MLRLLSPAGSGLSCAGANDVMASQLTSSRSVGVVTSCVPVLKSRQSGLSRDALDADFSRYPSHITQKEKPD